MCRSISPYIAVLGLVVAGCKDDLRPMTAEWNTVTAKWQTRADALKASGLDQTQKLSALCATAGLDPGNVAAKTCAGLKETQLTDQAQFDTLRSSMARHQAEVAKAIKRGKGPEVSAAMEAAKGEVTALLGRVSDKGEPRDEALKSLQAAVTSELEAAKVAAIAAEAKAELWRQAAVDRKPLELTDVRFTKGTAELEAPDSVAQSQLQEFKVWANRCPELRFTITSHESKELAAAEAMKLTRKRAVAVEKFLVDNGVAASKIVRASGNGSKTQIADEPAPASAAARAMNPEELEALRNKNRRITIQAVDVCPEVLRGELVRQ